MLEPAAWFWLPLIAAIVLLTMAMASRQTAAIRVLRGMSVGFVVLSLATTALWTWLLRDGMGPYAVASTGALARRRFAEQYAFPLLIDAIALTVVLWVCRWRLRVSSSVSSADAGH